MQATICEMKLWRYLVPHLRCLLCFLLQLQLHVLQHNGHETHTMKSKATEQQKTRKQTCNSLSSFVLLSLRAPVTAASLRPELVASLAARSSACASVGIEMWIVKLP
jgi:hypothetical protein